MSRHGRFSAQGGMSKEEAEKVAKHGLLYMFRYPIAFFTILSLLNVFL